VTLTEAMVKIINNMKVTISRKAHFNSAHRLYRKDWTFEKNDAVFESAIIRIITVTMN
jgi:6-pyruvoyltetrahydropterin/6-carboxytetrahydropterin synthase